MKGPATIDRATGEIIPSKAVPDGTLLARQLLLTQEETSAPAVHAHVVWQLHSKYILTPIENGLMIIDQHVAHERVLYERVLERFDSAPCPPQQILFPFTVEFTAGDHALVMELLPHLEKLGFAIKPFGKNTVMIEGVPPDLQQGSNEKIIEEILALYKEYHDESPMEVRNNLAKSFSCKAAIKAGDKLSEQQMQSLIDQLFSTRMPFVCPHGRPIVLKISTEEFDRRFGRT
jgi:DNA mismatch repair protein MutL